MNTAVPSALLSRFGHAMVWLGGGNWRDIDDEAERSTYQTAGFFVLLNAVIAWGVAIFAVMVSSDLALFAVLPLTLVCGLLVGAFGRILATSVLESGRARLASDATRAAVAVLIGIAVGEIAALAIFAGPVNRELHDQADQARASVSASDRGERLQRLRDDRARLDERISEALDRRDQAEVVARCEFNPGPECPGNRITGVPGQGDEARLAETALANAERDLAAARTEREQEGPKLDASIGALDAELEVQRDEAEALALADSGLDARWRAMHSYTTDNPAALLLRLGVVAFFVLLNLLPLLLRLWRGQTELDRRIAARRLRTQAEEEADTAIALKRAQVRATRELRAQDELLRTPLLDGGSSRRVQEAEQPLPATLSFRPKRELLALPAGTDAGSPNPNLPALSGDKELQTRHAGPLDALPGPLPQVARAFGGLVRPLVPEQVVRLAENPPRPLKTARTLLEEVEEFQFSLLRKRKVTITEEKSDDEPRHEEPAGQEKALRRSAVATRILDLADRRSRLGKRAEAGPGLTAAEQRARRELPLGDRVRQLARADRKELPPGGRKELPPGATDAQ